MLESKKLGQQLSALFDTADKLNTSSQRINTILQTVEAQLVEAKIGLEVWLEDFEWQELSRTTHSRDNDYPEVCAVQLGFARVADTWHLAVREITGHVDTEGDWTCEDSGDPHPLAQASRKDRIAALRLLPALVAALNAEAEKAIQTIQEAEALIAC